MDTIEITLYGIFGILWFLSAISDYAHYAYFWQLKWYRYDRFKDFLHTKQGRQFILNYRFLKRPFLILAVLAISLHSGILAVSAMGTIYLIDVLYTCTLIFRRKLRRPKISIKILIILALSLLIEPTIFFITSEWSVLPIILLLRLFIISVVVLGIDKATGILKKAYFYLAKKKLKKYPKLKVIGITGSYGKTSTKEFLANILGESFNVVKTPKNINSDIGITRFILSTNFEKKDIFIVEIGAYNIGDVDLICNIVNPTIGILTAINEQHISLFGSIENIQKAKYELLRTLPKQGLAITNSDNKYCREFLHQLDAAVQTFGYDKEYNPACILKKNTRLKTGFVLEAQIEKELYHAEVPIFGIYNALNIAPCILVAKHLGMDKKHITKRIETLQTPENGIQVFPYGKATVIDDSYNTNPNGFKAALHFLSSFSSKKEKIVITRGIMELGDKSEQMHNSIGEEISFVADEVVIITEDFDKDIRAGMHEKYQAKATSIHDHQELLAYIKTLKEKDVVVLLESVIPVGVYNEVTPKT
ncbi:MAG: UDP-N-acetylmuramoyl-tripeptide--D-alanyl-D-alanine ligase [Candidatus Magasanikbacteria bacterium]|jgi:UDP-N-acetylmuramoyl-tripeptide--D-alanyl-D-alanine ligase|nr:UDP-N-acetylmuramoyl-tripeptide--D-alanyl-D-alanine ligase [Candidatus Magasanikbacteria bacterium]MBT4221325.1 UDP-N-acetylmuramoyl-tripeptide--D-alanyl-D-alanine ligase [Candidatus Magasanikbacteria bacterium]MBT4350827.1 UDP-N-acetylmuramoyl-tripeptide--D-alanyl-D-alanine ligase [Candidatus Magasanikbacteria bacterium]MBT4542173.1 UDP-N-acetylmuramoyl-tripeptide--D-alanyl-D-alanine ligase [Candidatus Magasanikbacteria bacterium]MBT6253449.1 UDP-N-acetylmuramoyl-tripeptide--D-alanyl-D-alan